MTTPSDIPTFKFYEFNHRRAARGAVPCRVEVTYRDGQSALLWMTRKDIQLNIKECGESPGLTAALDAYKQSKP